MLAWQFTLVGRGDDISHLKILDLHPHPIYDFAMKTKVSWSKNVSDERACPPQILLGAMDTTFCVLLNTGVYLVSWIAGGHANTSPFIFSADGDEGKGPRNLSRVYRKEMKMVYMKMLSSWLLQCFWMDYLASTAFESSPPPSPSLLATLLMTLILVPAGRDLVGAWAHDRTLHQCGPTHH
jgi:hypothetical protein